MLPKTDTEETLRTQADRLAASEPVFAQILADFGHPPLWEREPGFAALVRIILEQQVSLASAKAAFDRLNEYCDGISAEKFTHIDGPTLRKIGFSQQKAGYCQSLANGIINGDIILSNLNLQPDESVRAELIRFKGIGPWTAEIYLLLVLRRQDAWPVQDRALAVAMEQAFGLPETPGLEGLACIGKRWQPYRSTAARILWHFYLSGGKKKMK